MTILIFNERIEAIINRKAPYHIDPHSHPHFELLYIMKGARKLKMHGRSYVGRAGDLIVFQPDEEHEEYDASNLISYFVLRFYPDELLSAKIKFPSMVKTGPVITVPNKERFLELFSKMSEEHSIPKEGSRLLLGAYLVEFVVMLERSIRETIGHNTQDDDSAGDRISKAVKIMRQNLSQDINLKDLAQNVFMSVSHFTHTFKNQTGQSPKRYLIKEKIAKAKELLAKTGKSAQEIAEMLGYENHFYFYRQFKRETGMTAGDFRSGKHR